RVGLLVGIGGQARVEPVLDADGADVMDHDAALVLLAAPVHILQLALAEHGRVVGHGAEDDHGPANAARAHVGFHVLGAVAAAVDGGAFHAHHGAGGVFDASVEQVGEVIPHLILGRVAGQFDVVDGPAGHASTPADDVHGEAVVLRVDARGDGEHAARGGAQCIRFRAIGED